MAKLANMLAKMAKVGIYQNHRILIGRVYIMADTVKIKLSFMRSVFRQLSKMCRSFGSSVIIPSTAEQERRKERSYGIAHG
jgi:hypothetical protein